MVTCFTCHRGSNTPVTSPKLALQYGEPEDDPNVMIFPPETRPAATEVLDKYIQALGGTAQLAKLTTFTARGTYSGFDTDHKEIPVDIYAKAPNQRTWIVHICLLYTSDAADERSSVDLGGRRIIKKKK